MLTQVEEHLVIKKKLFNLLEKYEFKMSGRRFAWFEVKIKFLR
jgi:hypothetical protein